jgi:hypothetical protein
LLAKTENLAGEIGKREASNKGGLLIWEGLVLWEGIYLSVSYFNGLCSSKLLEQYIVVINHLFIQNNKNTIIQLHACCFYKHRIFFCENNEGEVAIVLLLHNFNEFIPKVSTL